MKNTLLSTPLENNQLHDLITPARETGNAHYIVARKYSNTDMELISMTLGSDDSLKRGGGAKRKNDQKDHMDDLTLAKSQQRSRRLVKIKCRAGQVDRMLTLTYRENKIDYNECLKDFKKFITLMRKRFQEGFYYVAVPEEQKRGAYHFHIAIKGHYPVNTVRRLWRRALGNEHGSGSDSVGNIDITSPRKIGKASWNPQRIAQYISKYITKNESVSFNRKRYFSGGRIPEPQKFTGYLVLNPFKNLLFNEIFRLHVRTDPKINIEMDGFYRINYLST